MHKKEIKLLKLLKLLFNFNKQFLMKKLNHQLHIQIYKLNNLIKEILKE